MTTHRSPISVGELLSSGALEMSDGYRTKRTEYAGSGFRIIRVADVSDGAVRLDGPDFVSDSFARAIGSKAGQIGDILLTTKGTVGRVAVMRQTDERVVYSPQLCYFRVAEGPILDREYFRYWFSSPEFLWQASHRMNNTDMAAYINLADIRSLKLTLPPIEEQRAIADVLGALDDKIAANTKLAGTADEYIRSRYAAMAEVNSQVIRMDELLRNRKELVEPGTLDAGTPYLGLEHLPRRLMWANASGNASEVTSTKAGFRRGDVLFGKLRPYFHKVVASPWSGVCSTDVLVLSPRSNELGGFALAAAASDYVVERVTAASEGTRMPRTSWRDLASVEVPWPGREQAESFSTFVATLRQSVETLLDENTSLALTRDALLPQLMSGKLQARDAEELVSAVV